MVKLLLALGLIATISFGADGSGDTNFFSVLTDIFVDAMTKGLSTVSKTIKDYYINSIITAFLTLTIFIYAFRKIREATFEFPKDAYEICIFVIMVWFVNQCLTNTDFLFKVTSVLDIPSNSILEAISQSEDAKDFNRNNNIGVVLTEQLEMIFKNLDIFVGEGLTLNPFKVEAMSIIKLFIWGVYAIFGFILIASITMTYILTMIQVIFWKAFATLMIPLIYFKATRGMVIHWAKTIIALSLIAIFMLIIAIMSSNIEITLFHSLGEENPSKKGASFAFMGAIIIAKIIAITLLKEIPTMINGMLGTQAASGAGAFANTASMAAVGAIAGGAGFAALKSIMRGGKIGGGLAKTLGNAISSKFGGGAKSQSGGGVGSGGIGGGSAGKTNITGNVSKGISNLSSGATNSSQGNSFGQGMKNIWNGKAYQQKGDGK